MATNYAGENAIKKLTELVFGELGKKQDKMDEITEEEVRQMWEDENSELKDPNAAEPEPEPEPEPGDEAGGEGDDGEEKSPEDGDEHEGGPEEAGDPVES